MVLKRMHDAKIAGHLGVFKTYESVKKKYWWPKMREEIRDYIQTCQTCQKHKSDPKSKRWGLLQTITAHRPFEIIGMDIMTNKRTTSRGNRYLLVVTDYFTKWPEAFAMPDMKKITIARTLIANVFSRHGMPERIITDRGGQFMSNLYRNLMEVMQTQHSPSTPYHPQTDGQAERLIGSLKSVLKKLMDDDKSEWDEELPFALWAYRCAVNEVTKETPFFLMYGRDPEAMDWDFVKTWKQETKNPSKYAMEVVGRLERARERVKKQVQKSKEQTKTKHDKKRTTHPYRVGDIVWMENNNHDKNKFSSKYKGPYRIIKMGKKAINETEREARKSEEMYTKPVDDSERIKEDEGEQDEDK